MSYGTALRLGALLASDRLRLLRPGAEKYRPIRPQILKGETQVVACRKAHYDPGQLDRVVACGFKATLGEEIAKLEDTEFTEGPIKIATVRDATVIGGEIIYGTRRHFMSDRPITRAALGAIEEIDGSVTLANSQQGLKYFGHWLRDDCAMYRMLNEEFGGQVLSMQRPDWPDAAIYEAAFEQTWDERPAFHTPELTLVRALGFSQAKRDELNRLRAALRRTRVPAAPGGIVYLARGASGAARDVTNEEALTRALEARGVMVLRPEAGNAALIEALLDARVIITVEGSQAAHAVYTLASGGALLILQPPERFYNPHLEWTRLLGMEYGIVVGEARQGGFHIHPEEVLAMTDRLLTASARSADA